MMSNAAAIRAQSDAMPYRQGALRYDSNIQSHNHDHTTHWRTKAEQQTPARQQAAPNGFHYGHYTLQHHQPSAASEIQSTWPPVLATLHATPQATFADQQRIHPYTARQHTISQENKPFPLRKLTPVPAGFAKTNGWMRDVYRQSSTSQTQQTASLFRRQEVPLAQKQQPNAQEADRWFWEMETSYSLPNGKMVHGATEQLTCSILVFGAR